MPFKPKLDKDIQGTSLVFSERARKLLPVTLTLFTPICCTAVVLFAATPPFGILNVAVILVAIVAFAAIVAYAFISFREFRRVTFDFESDVVHLKRRFITTVNLSVSMAEASIRISEFDPTCRFYGYAIWIDVEGELFIIGCDRDRSKVVEMYENIFGGTNILLVEEGRKISGVADGRM